MKNRIDIYSNTVIKIWKKEKKTKHRLSKTLK